MKLNIEVLTDDLDGIAKLHLISQALMGISAPSAAQAKPASPPKAAAPSNAAPAVSAPSAASPAPAAAAEPSSASTPAAVSADAPAADFASVAAAFQTFVKANGPAKAKALLAETGFAKVQDIPQDQLGAFLAKLTA